jgi:hypothetical protein
MNCEKVLKESFDTILETLREQYGETLSGVKGIHLMEEWIGDEDISWEFHIVVQPNEESA